MSNSTLDLISRHGSVRKYRPDPVPVETIEAIVSAAQRTSTSSNMQAYSVVAVMDATKRARLAELCGNQEHIAQAPVFLAWCADLARLDRACELRGYTQETGYVENFLIAAVDAVIAAQTAALAAESLGLGICYIGSIRNNTQAVIDLLELPRLVFPVTGMTVGWPAGRAARSGRGCHCRLCCTGSTTTARPRRRVGRVRPGDGRHRHLRRPPGAGPGQAGSHGGLRLDRALGAPRGAGGADGFARGSGEARVCVEVGRRAT